MLVHRLPSSQDVPFVTAVWVTPLDASHASAVQGFPSSSAGAVPGRQLPPWHVSAPLQAFPSVHEVPSAVTTSEGQVSDVPSQVSAGLQTPFPVRHTVVLVAAEQVPTFPGKLQTPHPPLQAVSQQTPFAQNPVTHWLLDVQASPNDPS